MKQGSLLFDIVVVSKSANCRKKMNVFVTEDLDSAMFLQVLQQQFEAYDSHVHKSCNINGSFIWKVHVSLFLSKIQDVSTAARKLLLQ